MYELKKMERYLRVNLSGPGLRLIKKRIYRAAVSQRLRNTALENLLERRSRSVWYAPKPVAAHVNLLW